MKTTAERLAAFKNMAAADPQNELAHFSLGKAYFEVGDFAAAAAALRRTLELNPDHTLAHRYLGEALLRLGNPAEAGEALKKALLLADEKGEWKPREEILGLLREAGIEPPPLRGAKGAASPPAAGPAGDRVSGAAGSGAAPGASASGAFVCKRCGKPNPRLDEPPFRNELGREIHERICKPCWREWIAVSIKVINEYRLNLMLPEAQETYDVHLREFLGL